MAPGRGTNIMSDDMRHGPKTSQRDDSHERFLAALKASRCGTWRWDIARDVVEWDEALCQVYRIDPSAAPTNAQEFLQLIHPDDRESVWQQISGCLQSGGEAEYEFRTIATGEVRWIYDRSAVLSNEQGQYMLGACFDVTDRHRLEDERDQALQRQTVLLRELSHRVKNHLSMIIALLRMKATRQTDPAAAADFHRAIERINTLAYLHERLYRSDEVERVDLFSYIGDICTNLRESVLAETNITLEWDLAPVEVHVDTAVAVGLIANELITNAAKYAFAPGAKGRITVRVRSHGQRATLIVSDNGRGLDEQAAPGVGSRLVETLAAQIDGRMRHFSAGGLTRAIVFPLQGLAAQGDDETGNRGDFPAPAA